jgi:TRAP-type C4-dicarboxylate transport system permease small subunit
VTPERRWSVATILDAAVDLVVGVALIGELLVVITDVLGRAFFDMPVLWTDEVSSLALSVIAFVGGAIAYRREQHVFIRTIVDRMPERPRHACYALVDWVVLGIAVICFQASLGLLSARWDELTPILEMRGTWLALPLTVGMVVLALYALIRLRAQPVHAVIVGGVAAVGCLAAIVGFHLFWPTSLSTGAAVSVALVTVLGTALLGLPIGFALILGTMLFLYGGGLVSMVALPQNMVDGVSRFVLLALPFFILAGFVMEAGGISRRLVMFVASLVGRLRGGLLQVTVISMYLVSGISGSKAADVAAVGLVMRDMLEKEGYDSAEAAAALAASAAMGECVPPSAVRGGADPGSGDRAVPDVADLCAGRADEGAAGRHVRPSPSRALGDQCDHSGLDASIPVRRHFHRLCDADRGFGFRGGLRIADRGAAVP